MGFGAAQVLSGATVLSELGIDVSKDWATYLIKNMGDPVADQDAATKKYIDDLAALYLLLAGGTMSGAIAMGTNKITGMGDPTANQDAATKVYIDGLLDNVSQSEPTRSFGTTYQNTGGKIRLVGVRAYGAISVTGTLIDGQTTLSAYVSATTPPSDRAALTGIGAYLQGLGSGVNYLKAWLVAFFVVPPSYYYLVSGAATGDGDAPVIQGWFEWDLF